MPTSILCASAVNADPDPTRLVAPRTGRASGRPPRLRVDAVRRRRPRSATRDEARKPGTARRTRARTEGRREGARWAPACKPGPVTTRTWWTVIPLGVRSPARSSGLPAASWSGRAVPRRLFGLAPAGVYPATSVAGGAVRSYRTFSPLPDPLARPSAVCFLWHCPSPRRPCRHARRDAQALPGGPPCGARTFLDRTSEDPCRDRPADTHRTRTITSSRDR